ncbi:MAG: tetratricopeptide repeat protein [Sulfuricellaceae bacterium]|nr:tetratricopeptide repeat protein [Sulfuricellaceae bacterium]
MSTVAELFQQGVERQNAGDFFSAIACYGRVIALGGRSPELHYNLGFALQATGKDNEAIGHYLLATQLNPNFGEAFNNLGNIYQMREQLAEAQTAYERALAAKPSLVQACFNLGLVLKKQGALSKAVTQFQAACQLAPAYEAAWENLCGLLLVLKRKEEWLQAFLSYEKTAATPSAFAILTGLLTCRYLGDPEREQRYLDGALAWQFDARELGLVSQLLGIIQYFDVETSRLLALYQQYNRLMAQNHVVNVPLMLPRRTLGDKIRVGYLSPDFRHHVMGLLMRDVFGQHDTERFEIYAYSLAETRFDDGVTNEFKQLSHKFVNVAGLSPQEAARLISLDDLDILVDLGGHAAFARPEILAYKPARLQITHLGYHGAIGLDAVDYKMTDLYADLPENASFQIEGLLPMEGCVFPFRHVAASEQQTYDRTALGLDGKVVFGVFVNIMKLSPRCLAAWKQIIDQVPGAMLAFSPLDAGEHPGFIRQAKAAGIAEGKIAFIPPSKDESAARARYRLIDVVLDTFPYSGGDTTLAALDMGVPVVTLAGRRHSERTSFSILKNLGVESAIAADEPAFVEIACRLAMDKTFNTQVREAIQNGLKHSPLTDMAGHVRHLERAYVHALEEKGIRLDTASRLSATDTRSLFQNAVQTHQSGDLSAAETLYRQVLEEQATYAPALYLLGMVCRAQGATDQAQANLAAAVSAAPRYAEAWTAIGRMRRDSGESAEAVAALRQALEAAPGSVDVLNDLGLLLLNGGQTQEAIDTLRQAVAADTRGAESHFNLGVAYQKQGLLGEAARAYDHSIVLQPDHLEALFNLGIVMQDARRHDHAETCFRRVLARQPDREAAYRALGEILQHKGEIDAWLENFRQYEKHCAPSLQMACYAIEAYQYLGDGKKRGQYLEGVLKNTYPHQDTVDLLDGLSELLYLLLFFDVEARQMRDLYQAYNQALKQVFPERVALPATRKPGKIRLGYLSGDLRDHVMGKMVYQFINRHDQSVFEIYCYSLSAVRDAWTQKFVEASHKFVSLHGLDDVAATHRIAEDELDILVDLSTHTRGASTGVLAMKPARVQITHIASAGSVGCEAIDYKLTDHYADMPENQVEMIEKLLPMEGCVYPYRRIPAAEQHAYNRQSLGLPDQAVSLGAFVTLMKLSPRCLQIWRSVLEKLPLAYLVFSPLRPQAQPYYLRRLREAGIDPARVRFLPPGANESENQARYSVINMVLDTFPYGGANGTLEALDMGVPVVTLCGKRHGERSSFSILSNLGVTETIAQSGREYVDLVVKLATDKAFYEQVRNSIQTGLKHSPLVDMDAHTRNLEAVYLKVLGVL